MIARRMAKVPAAIDQWMKSLHSAADKGNAAPRHQVEACMKQCVDLTADDGYRGPARPAPRRATRT